MRDLGKDRNVVLVVTRGNTSPICPYCSTQTAHYIRDYEQFEERNAEVVIVYPVEAKGDQRKLDSFLADARGRLVDPNRAIPFPVVFDVELTAVNRLGIRKDLSKPATYIISPDGQVLYAYVDAHWGDRPATTVILEKLDGFQSTEEPQDVSSAMNPDTVGSAVRTEMTLSIHVVRQADPAWLWHLNSNTDRP